MKLEAGSFFGRKLQHQELRGFQLTATEYQRGLRIPFHSHELAHFCLVIQGSYEEETQGVVRNCAASTLNFYPPDTAHSEIHVSNGRHFLVETKDWRWSDVRDLTGKDPKSSRSSARHDCFSLATRLYNEFANPDQFSVLAMEAISLELLVGICREKREVRLRPRWLSMAEDLVRESLELSWSLKELASDVGVHPAHLARVFRQFHGCSIGEHVRKLRIKRACRKIVVSRESLAQIALETGFVDQSHFSRSFKRLMGMTPGDFAALYRQH